LGKGKDWGKGGKELGRKSGERKGKEGEGKGRERKMRKGRELCQTPLEQKFWLRTALI